MPENKKQKHDKKNKKHQKTDVGFFKKHGILHILFWVFLIPIILFFLIYIKLSFSPISLKKFDKQINEIALKYLPPEFDVKLGDAFLARGEKGLPVIQFSPVILNDKKTRAKIKVKVISLGFSPLKTLIGQPGVDITLISPQIKIIQDLHGPRLGDFEFVQGENGENPAIWVLEGENSFPNVNITSKGLDAKGDFPKESQFKARSDNDLMIANFTAMSKALSEFKKLALLDKISSLKIKNGNINLHDSVYGFFREFKKIDFSMSLDTKENSVLGVFSTQIANRLVKGEFNFSNEDVGKTRLSANITNLDFASFLSFLDDPKSLIALKGSGDINIAIDFNKDLSINSGRFFVEPTNNNIRLQDKFLPLSAKGMEILWSPNKSKLKITKTKLKIGQSFANVGGEFFLGFDENFGPTVSMLIKASDINIHPSDLDAPISLFQNFSFSGWAAPLYGALGIDQAILQKKDDAFIWAKGRADLLRQGMGLNMQIKGQGLNVDDLKRLWPYFLAGEARSWFVKNAKNGMVKSLDMKFNFPAGSMPDGNKNLTIPKGAINIDVNGIDAEFIPWEGLNLLKSKKVINIKVRDYITTATIKAANLKTKNKNVALNNNIIIIDGTNNEETIFELSADISTSLNSIIEVARIIIPNELKQLDIPIDIDSLTGDVNSSTLFTISVPKESAKKTRVDYAANGMVHNFSSSQKIGGYDFSDGEFKFSLSQLGYNFNGNAKIAGFDADVNIEGQLEKEQKIQVATELNVKQIKEFGIDLSQFLNGSIKFIIEPLKGGNFKLFADLKNSSINIADLGIKKAKGKKGRLEAIITQNNDEIKISDLAFSFGNVKIAGSMLLNKQTGFQSASFPVFALSKNDIASLVAKPIKNGLSIKIRGKRMDLKSMLKRSFSLEQPSTSGVRSTQYQKTLLLDIELNQAIGFYGVIGHGFDLLMKLKGNDLTKVSLQTQFAKNNAVSIATNPTQNGRTMSVAFDDAGTLLRFLNIYSRLLGGKGSVVFAKNTSTKIDNGEIFMSDFALVDENKVAQIIGQDRDSRKLIANENRINFKFGKASFIRKKGSIEIIDGVIDGGEVGGTLSGFIHTTANEYDLIGTYIPLFGLNSIFQKIPLFGVILGGKEGEGLIGVTFAVRGKLNDPQFIINPVSILAPGMFRSLFEFRAREKPVTQ